MIEEREVGAVDVPSEVPPGLKRAFPPRPLLLSLLLTTLLVWAVARALLTAGDRAVAGVLGADSGLRPGVRVLLALAVAWVALQDNRISRERIFAQNLGVAPFTLFGLALATALLCEALLTVWPALSLLARGG